MVESDIQLRCRRRGWSYNVCSAYILETDLTPYTVAKTIGVNRSVVFLWLHSEKLSGAVQFLFLLLRKIWLTNGQKITDWF